MSGNDQILKDLLRRMTNIDDDLTALEDAMALIFERHNELLVIVKRAIQDTDEPLHTAQFS